MHICHCYKNFQLSGGGVEQIIIDLSREYIKEGHTVSILTSWTQGQPVNETIEGIKVFRTRPLFTVFKVPIMPKYYKCLNNIGADIIQAHATVPGVSDIAVLFAHNTGKPCAIYYHFDGNADSIIGTLFANIYNSIINPIVISMANKTTATSRSYAETSPVLKKHRDMIEIMPNCADMNEFNPNINKEHICEKYGLPDKHIVLFVGRFVKYKGLEYLIRAMEYVQKGTLVVVGTGPQEEYLRRLIKRQKLQNVIFVGHIAHDELPKLYRASDVYVLPAITRGENFGISALEAMACGIPVVASDFPWMRELVKESCGFTVQPKNIMGLAEAINQLLDDENLRIRMGEAARKNAMKYNSRDIAVRFIRIYEDLIKESKLKLAAGVID